MSTIRFERQGALGILRLDKGRGNAIDDALLEDLAKWAVEAARDDQLRGVLLASAHPKLFCPGLDLVTLVDRDREAMRDFMGRFAQVLWGLFGLLKPVVASINGHAVAGGCILALTADYRVMARGAQIGLNEVKIGVPLPWSVVMLLKSTVPPGSLSEVALLGNNFADEEAVRVGLVDAVADRERLEQQALARLQEFAEKDQLAFGATKGWMRSQTVATMKAHETETADVWLDAWFSAPTRERLRHMVSLSVANEGASLPVAWQLYLPEIWLDDPERRQKAKIPDEIVFQTKPQIAIDQIRAALAVQTPVGVVLADAGYGADGEFRRELSDLGLVYSVGVQPTVSVWRPGEGPLPPKPWSGKGRPPRLMQRSKDHKPLSAKALAESLPAEVWKTVNWREGTNVDLTSRFAAVRLRVASRDYNLTQPRTEEWFIVEWPEGDKEPLKYWLSTLPETMMLQDLVAVTKMRWRIERDYRELKQELGLGHYEGRGWRGFHHHASLCIAAYGFLLSERETIPPSGFAVAQNCEKPPIHRGSRSGTSTDTAGTAHLKLDRHAA